jgi:hypothetical protein
MKQGLANPLLRQRLTLGHLSKLRLLARLETWRTRVQAAPLLLMVWHIKPLALLWLVYPKWRLVLLWRLLQLPPLRHR